MHRVVICIGYGTGAGNFISPTAGNLLLDVIPGRPDR